MSYLKPVFSKPRLAAIASVAAIALVGAQSAAARTLKLGSRGAAVRTVQRDLTKVGIKTAVTGTYNKVTRSHVMKFQRTHGLSVDGVVGPMTYAALVKAAKGKTTTTTTTTSTTTATTASANGGTGIGGGSAGFPSSAIKLTIDKKTGLVNIPTSGIPSQVTAALKAANQIAKLPYKWAGGHANWKLDTAGYDCSGSVSWVLHAAGLMTPDQNDSESLPEDSVQFYTYGQSGASETGWFNVWTDDGHAYIQISNLWFDTVSQQETGDRWSATNVENDNEGFTERSPIGW